MINKSHGDLNSFNSNNYFPLCPPWLIFNPAPSPVGFNSPIIFQSLLLKFSCANPATQIAHCSGAFVFETLDCTHTFHTSKNSSCTLTCLFQSLDYFERLLLKLQPKAAHTTCSRVQTVRFQNSTQWHSLPQCHNPPVKMRCRDSSDGSGLHIDFD